MFTLLTSLWYISYVPKITTLGYMSYPMYYIIYKYFNPIKFIFPTAKTILNIFLLFGKIF